MAKQKVSDLTPEEQEKIIIQLRELDVQGAALAKTWTVENVNKKIAAKLAEKNGTPPATETPADASMDAGAEAKAKADAEAKAKADAEAKVKADAEAKAKADADAKAKENKKPLKCHICRSDVVDGKCTGCGFSIGL